MPKDLLVYVNIPFCNSKCTFCDWVQEIRSSDLRLTATDPRRQRYIAALIEQIQAQGPALSEEGYVPKILYWGGGTASILEADEMERVMDALARNFDLSQIEEATLECSPETINKDKLKLAYRLGFKRISLGIQSLDDQVLRVLGRVHDAAQAMRATRLAAEAGFEEINIDILSGAPTDRMETFEASLSKALTLPATHVSFYPFRPTPGTMIGVGYRNGRFGRLALDEQLSLYDHGRQFLEDRGFSQYSVIHFGKNRCKSDSAYFRLMMDWVGFGSGATSLLNGTFMMAARERLSSYVEAPCAHDYVYPAASDKVVSRQFYQSLHMPEGAEASFWEARTGASFADIIAQPEVQALTRKLGAHAKFTCDDTAAWLDPAEAGHAFIHLLNDYAPVPTHAVVAAQNIQGSY